MNGTQKNSKKQENKKKLIQVECLQEWFPLILMLNG
jgi:hypothetical protein